MTGPQFPPPHGLSLPIRWRRVIDGNTIEAILPSGRSVHIRIEGFDAPELPTEAGRSVKHVLESLLEEAGDLTAFVPLPGDSNKNGKLDLDIGPGVFGMSPSCERLRAYLFVGSIRVDLWMIEHGYVK